MSGGLGTLALPAGAILLVPSAWCVGAAAVPAQGANTPTRG
ncbi:MAG: hypothetical protein ACK4PG_04770 [Acetobacteraceae bacterium]